MKRWLRAAWRAALGCVLSGTCAAQALPEPAKTAAAQLAAHADRTPDAGDTTVAAPRQDDVELYQSLSILTRNYAEELQIHGGATRDAWLQGTQLRYGGMIDDGTLGVGVDAALFADLKLNGGSGARSMVRLGPGGIEQHSLAWAYPGIYVLKAQLAGVGLQYGLQSIVNPFIQPYDNRALPPTFKGLALTAQPFETLSLAAGEFDAVMARGYTHLQPLSTAYGGKPVRALSYLGADWRDMADDRLSWYVSSAREVWKQLYVSAAHVLRRDESAQWTARADLYATRNHGADLQGQIDNRAFSFAVCAQQRAFDWNFSYQRIEGNQFFDFLQETTGGFLANSGGADYNAPHEQSLRMKLNMNEKMLGVRGWQAAAWVIAGWGADAAAEAAIYSAPGSLMHDQYWKGGQPQHGSHHEFGFKPIFTVQDGAMRNMSVVLTLISHSATKYYSSNGFMDYRLNINMPLKIL